VLAGFGVEAAAHMPTGGLTLAHVVELVLIVAVTTNFMQFAHFKCNALSRSAASHAYRFSPFYLASLATPFLCFPKMHIVVGDLMPSTRSVTVLLSNQHSAMVGTFLIFVSAVALLYVQKTTVKRDPLLTPS